MSGKTKRPIFWVLTCSISIAAALVLAEAMLHLTGHRPWRHYQEDAHEPTMHQPHPGLGWENKPGRYLIPAYTPGTRDVEVAFQADGTRVTGPADVAAPTILAAIGGSYTMGWAVSDRDTYPWQLQRLLPSLRIVNYGVSGYGTYQSLLMLERVFAEQPSPATVVYGFIVGHERRNVAVEGWLDILSRYANRAMVRLPYCTVEGDGRLVRHPPEAYPSWPMARWLASVALLQDVYCRGRCYRRSLFWHRRVVTGKLLLAMNDRCHRHGAKLLVAVLFGDPEFKYYYSCFFRKHGIWAVDCTHPHALADHLRVPGDGHPNGRLHAHWATRIAGAVRAGDD